MNQKCSKFYFSQCCVQIQDTLGRKGKGPKEESLVWHSITNWQIFDKQIWFMSDDDDDSWSRRSTNLNRVHDRKVVLNLFCFKYRNIVFWTLLCRQIFVLWSIVPLADFFISFYFERLDSYAFSDTFLHNVPCPGNVVSKFRKQDVSRRLRTPTIEYRSISN